MRSYPSNLLFSFFLSIVLLGITSCQSILTPRLIFWHSFENEQAEVLNSAVNRFSEIFNNVVIVPSYVPSDEMVERYIAAASQGLGPDLFIAPNDTLNQLVSLELITPLPEEAINTSLYYTASLATATFDDTLYGVPFAMRPLAMYVNLDMVERPATTLNELLAQAETGTGVAVNTQFRQLAWGIQAYGGQILDEQGRVILNQGAFTNWLNWLLNANSNPQIFLSRDTTTLRRLFFDERVAYYTGTAAELTAIRSQMGADKVGVIPLPSDPNGASGPLMQSDLLLFNPSSSGVVHRRAIELAIFLTNLEQANAFMRDLELVPANRRVRVDLRTYPAIAGFIAQTRTAIALPYLPQVTRLLEQGDDIVLQVLEGVLASNTAAEQLTEQVNNEFSLGMVESSPIGDLSGALTLWHSFTGNAQIYLNDMLDGLLLRCPRLTVDALYIPANDLLNTYLESFQLDNAPDFILASTHDLQRLVDAGSVMSIEREWMQIFSPIGQATVTLDGVAYGIPMALFGNVMYYNRDLIADTPVITDELLDETSPPFVLSRQADGLLWSLTAYNGLTVSNEVLAVDVEQVTLWLDWLRRLARSEHVEIVANRFLRTSEFVEGNSAYLVASNRELNDLTLALGDALGVAPFPTATSSFASTRITAQAFFVNGQSGEHDTALGFIQLLTDELRQERMVEALRWVPANTIADGNLGSDPIVDTIHNMLQMGIVLNHTPDETLSAISQTIDRVLRTEQSVELIAQTLFDQLIGSEETE